MTQRPPIDPRIAQFITRMPKAELHVHLEGAVRPDTWLKLAQRNGVSFPATTPAEFEDYFRFRNFDHFVEVYTRCCSCLATSADFQLSTYELIETLGRENIQYAEVFLSPTLHLARGLAWDTVMEGVAAGASDGLRDFGVEVRFLPDISRELGPERGMQVARHVAQSAAYGVVGIGLGGPETGFPPEWYADAFAVVAEAGMHRVAHAGETEGPDSVWGALNALGAERIGHGVRSIEDPELVARLRHTGVPLEVCPSSNLRIGLYPDWESHPFPRLLEAGLNVTLNSDDPAMFGASLTDEYLNVHQAYGLSVEALEALSLNALRASFLSEPEKDARIARYREEFSLLRHELGLVPV